MDALEVFRAQKDDFFRSDYQSPLTPEQRREFSGLKYFPENPALRLELRLVPAPTEERVEMQTSTGEVQVYVRRGKMRFQAEGQDAELTLFEGPNGYFLPFVDSLAGQETYPAGRYLDPEPLADGKFLVDFNLAYNPYCAYNDHWSCPLTPFENRLRMPIRAGERLFDRTH